MVLKSAKLDLKLFLANVNMALSVSKEIHICNLENKTTFP